MRGLTAKDYAVDAVTMAKALVGAWLCRRLDDGTVIRRRITETEAHLEDAEGALLFGANAKGGVGAARHVANLEGVDDALGIADVAKGIVFGVEQTELLLEGFEALGSVALFEQLAVSLQGGASF